MDWGAPTAFRRVISELCGSGVVLATRPLAELAQHGLKALGEFDVADRTQRVNDDVELGGRENEVQAIRFDIELRLTCWIGHVAAGHGAHETIAPADGGGLRHGPDAVAPGEPRSRHVRCRSASGQCHVEVARNQLDELRIADVAAGGQLE